MKRKRKKLQRGRGGRFKKAGVSGGDRRTYLTGLLSSEESKGDGPGRPGGWSLSDARCVELMQRMTTVGFEAKWYRFMCARPEFSWWTEEDRELFVQSYAGRPLDKSGAAFLIHSMADCVLKDDVLLDRLILVGASLFLSSARHEKKVSSAIETVTSWRRKAREFHWNVKRSAIYRSIMAELNGLTGMSETELVDRYTHLHHQIWPAIGHWREIKSKLLEKAHGRVLDLQNPKIRARLEKMVQEDRRLNRIPENIIHPHEMALALSDLPWVEPKAHEGSIVPFVRCSAPGCKHYLDAVFFRQAQGKGAPPLTVCTEHSLHYWTIIERYYPDGILGLLKGGDAKGFDVASHWQEPIIDDGFARVRPAYVRIAKIGDNAGVYIDHPELDPTLGGIWADLHQHYRGDFRDGVYTVQTANGDVQITHDVIAEMTDAVIILHAQDTLPLYVTSEPFVRWDL